MSAAPPSARQVWGVSALLLATGDALAARFGAVAVRGELSGFSRAASGHCYFNLKDADGNAGVLRCAMFRRAATLLDFAPADGQQVELRGRLGVYEARGELQLIVEAMQRMGAGSLYEQFLRLRDRLSAQGLFDPARKRRIPPHPRHVGVVSSMSAAALRDVLTTLARRSPQVRVTVYPSPVQGADAPPALVEALQLAAHRREVDVLLMVRGGGSLEDLWAFNDERVVRALADSPIPTICGVGHETDVSLCDLAADLRAPTPTAAAELAAPRQEDCLAAVAALAERLERAARRTLDRQAQRLDLAALRIGRPGRLILDHGRRLDLLEHRLAAGLVAARAGATAAAQSRADRMARAMAQALERRARRLDDEARRLDSVDPRRVLARGYAWVTDEQGRPVVSAASLQAGQGIEAVWADGRARASVTAVSAEPPEP